MESLFTDPSLASILLITAFIAGFVDSIAGGGGLLMMPAMLTAGVPAHLTLGTNKLAATFGTLTAARMCIKRGIFKPHYWWAGIGATFIGAFLGALATWFISAVEIKRYLPVIIIFTALYLLFSHQREGSDTKATDQPQTNIKSVLLGGGLGFYDGLIGPGTGAFWTTAAMAVYKIDLLEAFGVARFMNFISNVVALGTFMLLGQVDYWLGIALGVSLMIGSYIGVHSVLRLGSAFIRPVFMSLVMLISLRLVYMEWF